jgi:UDP-glucose 4-epimerase
MTRVLVTGGAGFIGSHLVERLLAEKSAVTVIDDLSTGSLENLASVATHPALRIIQSKISNCTALEDIVADCSAVFHLAAAVGVDLIVRAPIQALQTNLYETHALLEIVAKTKTPFLLTSTSEVYGKSLKPEFSEEDDLLIGPPHQSRWSYACSKLMDEFLTLAYAKEHSVPVTIVRLFNTVGPRQTGRFGMVLPRFIQAARTGRPLQVHGDGQQTRCFCYAADAVEAILRLQRSEKARGGIFNVGGTEEVTVLELAKTVIRILGSTSTIALVPYSQAYEPGFDDMRRRKPSLNKLKKAIGFVPETSLEEIIARTALNES